MPVAPRIPTSITIPPKTKKPTRRVHRVGCVSARVYVDLTLERTCSDTTAPLSAAPLSRVAHDAHRPSSIAWQQMIRTFFHNWERRLASATDDRVVRPFE